MRLGLLPIFAACSGHPDAPHAPERPEGCTFPAVWHADADGDGWGTAEISTRQCRPPEGYVASADDCDDADPAVHPGTDEHCDTIDEDCDGVVDDDPIDCPEIGDVAWVPTGMGEHLGEDVATVEDMDGDGLPEVAMVGSLLQSSYTGRVWAGPPPPEGTVRLDDRGTHALLLLIAPTRGGPAAVSIASGGKLVVADSGDGGLVGVADPTSRGLEYLADGTVITGGQAAASADLDVDGVSDLITGYRGDYGYLPGSVYLIHGPVTGQQSSVDAAYATIQGDGDNAAAGTAVDGGGDFDGDGFPDFAFGAPGQDGNCTMFWSPAAHGSAYVFTTRPTGTVQAADADLKVAGRECGTHLGMRVQLREDFDGDGRDDLLAAGFDRAVHVYQGQAGLATPPDVVRLVGGDVFAAIGDLDGDGAPDLAVGDVPYADVGRVYLVHGPLVANVHLARDVPQVLAGVHANDGFGSAIAGGDYDGDGLVDLVVGAPRMHDVGAVYLFWGKNL